MDEINGLVTVIIPAYNRVNYIEDTVRSVLVQTYDNFELIVVDDGSTDGTFEILKSFEERGDLRLMFHPGRINKGQSASINVGLKASRGEFVAILDSDDLFAPHKLKSQVDYLNTNKNIGLVYGNGIAIDGAGNYLYDIEYGGKEKSNDPDSILLDCYFLLPQNSLVRRSVYHKVGLFEEEFRAGQDHDMLIRIAEKSNIGYLPEVFFYYRRHDSSISAKGQKVRWQTGFEILRRARNRHPYKAVTLRKRAAVLNFRLGQALLKEKKILSAAPYLFKSGLLDPARALKIITGREGVR